MAKSLVPNWIVSTSTLPQMRVMRVSSGSAVDGVQVPTGWPLPELRAPAAEVAGWRERNALGGAGKVVALAPGAVGPSKRWPTEYYADLARSLVAQGASVWVTLARPRGSFASTPA